MHNLKDTVKNSPHLLLILGFLMVISVGTLILSTPYVTSSGESTPLFTALFTATSATCVNGLMLVDTGTYFNKLGHVIIMILIQIGGIGIMAFAIIFLQIFKGKLSIKNRLNIQAVYNSNSLGNTLEIIKVIFFISLISELIGTAALSFVFIPEYGINNGLFFSLFHSVSAFNNAGFDIMGNFSSLSNYVDNYIVNITIIFLVLIGSIGFLTIMDIYKKKSIKKLSLNTKIVLLSTGILLLFGTVCFFIFEYNNSKTIGNLNFIQKLLASLFLSVTPKSAGFNTIDIPSLTMASSILFTVFMYIGASPTSTGGGLKTTTVIMPILSLISLFKGKEDIEIFERRIPNDLVKKATALICLIFLIALSSIILLSITEEANISQIVFEVSAAINTVGISFGLTPYLSKIGKCIILLLMFIGRIGPLSIIMALSLKQNKLSNIKYIEEKILIG